MWRREKVEYEGKYYQLPLPADQGTGLGKSLKLINRPVREDIPIYVASLGPKNVQMTAELAEGWLPIFFHPDKAGGVWDEDIAIGTAARREGLGTLEVVAGGVVSICDKATAEQLRNAGRGLIAMYVGGMGAKGKNFYNTLFQRYGYGEAAEQIQDLYLDGHRGEAEALVPDDYLAATTMAGDEGFVRDRIEAFRACRRHAPVHHPHRRESSGVDREGEGLGRVARWRPVSRVQRSKTSDSSRTAVSSTLATIGALGALMS